MCTCVIKIHRTQVCMHFKTQRQNNKEMYVYVRDKSRCREMPQKAPINACLIDRSLRNWLFFADKGSFFADKD